MTLELEGRPSGFLKLECQPWHKNGEDDAVAATAAIDDDGGDDDDDYDDDYVDGGRKLECDCVTQWQKKRLEGMLEFQPWHDDYHDDDDDI